MLLDDLDSVLVLLFITGLLLSVLPTFLLTDSLGLVTDEVVFVRKQLLLSGSITLSVLSNCFSSDEISSSYRHLSSSPYCS